MNVARAAPQAPACGELLRSSANNFLRRSKRATDSKIHEEMLFVGFVTEEDESLLNRLCRVSPLQIFALLGRNTQEEDLTLARTLAWGLRTPLE